MSHEPPRLITTIGFPGSPHTPVLLIAPPNFQACCFQANPTLPGFCVDLPPFFCTGFTGVPQGPDTVCPVDCDEPVPGACCLADGGCVEVDSDNCPSPDFFIAGGSCEPDPCAQPKCWFVGTNCCPDNGGVALVAVRCDLALLLGGLFDVGPVYYIKVLGQSCYCIDTSGPTIDEITDEQEVFPVLDDLFAECESECCPVIGEPCPPIVPLYCFGCPSPILGIDGFTFTPTGNCGMGGTVGTVVQLVCNENEQEWQGILVNQGPGPPILGPDGVPIHSAYKVDCDGITDLPLQTYPNIWLLRMRMFGFSGCPKEWIFDIRISAPRGKEDYPNGSSFEIVVDNFNDNIESYTIDIPGLNLVDC